MLLSSLMGGALLMGRPAGARLLAPQELPVGVLTAVLGGGYFVVADAPPPRPGVVVNAPENAALKAYARISGWRHRKTPILPHHAAAGGGPLDQHRRPQRCGQNPSLLKRAGRAAASAERAGHC